MDGTVLWWKLRPFSERLSLATCTEDKHRKEESRCRTVKMKTKETKPNWLHKAPHTQRGLCCRKYIQATAKNKHARCYYFWVNLWFPVYVRSSQKRLLTPKRTNGFSLKVAAFTFLSIHFPLVRGFQTASRKDDHTRVNLLRSSIQYLFLQFFLFSSFICPLTIKLTQHGNIFLWLNWEQTVTGSHVFYISIRDKGWESKI